MRSAGAKVPGLREDAGVREEGPQSAAVGGSARLAAIAHVSRRGRRSALVASRGALCTKRFATTLPRCGAASKRVTASTAKSDVASPGKYEPWFRFVPPTSVKHAVASWTASAREGQTTSAHGGPRAGPNRAGRAGEL